MIRDPRFAATVNDIVVECGNARYQDVIDRFVRGEDIPDQVLRQVWENTTVTNSVCDSPVYQDLFRSVRAVNARLSDRQVRVLLGDPPIDWNGVRTFADLLKWGDERDTHLANVIRQEVLAKQRRALVTYGLMHFRRRNDRINYEQLADPRQQTVVELLEGSGATKVFTIWTVGRPHADLRNLQSSVGSWPTPSLAFLRGTVLGAADFQSYFTSDGRFGILEGKLFPLPREQWRTFRMEDQFDAVLYLGPPSTITIARLSPARCSDQPYMDMRLGRMALVPGGQVQIDQLKQYCDAQAGR